MTVMDAENALFQAKRTALAFSLILMPGTALHLLSGYPLFDAISATSIWLVPGLAYLFLFCRTKAAILRLLVFLLPFGRMHSSGIVTFCWLWPVSIPMFRRFNRRLDSGSHT